MALSSVAQTAGSSSPTSIFGAADGARRALHLECVAGSANPAEFVVTWAGGETTTFRLAAGATRTVYGQNQNFLPTIVGVTVQGVGGNATYSHSLVMP
ncbi:MAG: hypothetical protein IBJ10_10025 [Phycisphaerales bacterium]|nr:hypothetical protein [Phycisphaerales bacterium]